MFFFIPEFKRAVRSGRSPFTVYNSGTRRDINKGLKKSNYLCFIISVGVSSDHSQLRCRGFAGKSLA